MKRLLATLTLSAAVLASALPAWSQEVAAPASSTPATSPAAARKERVAVIHLSGALTERPESFSLSLATLLVTAGASAQAPDGEALFATHCMACH